MAQYTNYILVCGGTGCRASQSEQIIENLRAAVEQYGLEDTQVIRTGCFGFCEKGPVVKMIPDNTFYVQVQPSDADEIVREHLVKGRKVERLLYMNPETRELVPDSKHIGFYKKQLRIALRNCGFINPENIDEYIARDGYVALGKALVEMTPEEVIKEIMDSGLRGRGGGGFPTGLKWQITRKVQAPQKYVVCNADEGDPGAFMDRSILEGDPHSIVEAMAINGYCTGASKGLVYIRAEYPLAVERLKIAIRQAKEYGLLGENIFGTDFSFDIEIRYGAGAFVCGEETALIHTISCATCHGLNTGGVDRKQYSEGINGQFGGVNAPTVYNAALNFVQFWDGRAADLKEQAAGPPLNPVEMGCTSFDQICEALAQDKDFTKKFTEVYPEGYSQSTITDAIAEFEKTLLTPSRFDKYLMGDKNALTAEELEGYQLFKDNKCATCHVGVNVGGQSYEFMGIKNSYFDYRNTGLTDGDNGRYAVTKKESDRHKFKTPTLRNVMLTYPYMHDGTVASVEDAIRIMHEFQIGKEINDVEVEKIVVFLRTLNGEYNGKMLQ